jgi:hypothetical protein
MKTRACTKRGWIHATCDWIAATNRWIDSNPIYTLAVCSTLFLSVVWAVYRAYQKDGGYWSLVFATLIWYPNKTYEDAYKHAYGDAADLDRSVNLLDR